MLPFRASELFEWFLLCFFLLFFSFPLFISLFLHYWMAWKKGKNAVAAVPSERWMTHSSARHRFVLYIVHGTTFLFKISFITFLMLIYIRRVYLVPFSNSSVQYLKPFISEVKFILFNIFCSTLRSSFLPWWLYTYGKSILFQSKERRLDEWHSMQFLSWIYIISDFQKADIKINSSR